MNIDIQLEVIATAQDKLLFEIVIEGKKMIRLNYLEFQEFKRIINSFEIGIMKWYLSLFMYYLDYS